MSKLNLSAVIEVNGEAKDFSTLKEEEKEEISKQLTFLKPLDARLNLGRKGGLNL